MEMFQAKILLSYHRATRVLKLVCNKVGCAGTFERQVCIAFCMQQNARSAWGSLWEGEGGRGGEGRGGGKCILEVKGRTDSEATP